MDHARAQAILAHAERRRVRREAMLAAAAGIPQQLEAITDPAHLLAFFCTRRAGKSFGIGLKLFLVSLEHPGCSCLYMGLTQDSAVGTLNKDILQVLNKRFAIGAKWREKDNRWELPNGSLIYLRGADANQHEMAKILGQKYRLAILDEVAKYRGNVHNMVYGDLLPAMGDDVGTIILSGVPSNITAGLFFDVTTGKEPGWSVHRWTWQDNVYKRDNIRKIHDELVAANPARVRTSSYRQEWLGDWVVDEGALVYKFSEDINVIAALPRPASEYSYLLGIDLGFNDPTAFVVGAYSAHDPVLYLVYAAKHEGIIIDTVARLVKALWKNPTFRVGGHPAPLTGPYPFERMIVDGAALQSVEEMRQKHGLPLECAKKTDKRTAIEGFNSDLQTGRIKLLPAAFCILEEGQKLIWDERKLNAVPKRWEEDPRQANHACLVAGTQVECERGPVPIERVRVGDRVMTRAGWRDVIASWCSGVRPTWRLGPLVGTAEHPVWVEEIGMTPMANIGCDHILLAWANTDRANAWSSAERSSVGIRKPLTVRCESTSPPSAAEGFMSQSGRPSMGRCRKGTMFTTATRILSTIHSTISSAFRPLLTCAGTCRRSAALRQGLTSTEYGLRLLNGIGAMPAGPGTLSMAGNAPQSSRSTSTCATSAAGRMRQGAGSLTSAGTTAPRRSAAGVASMTSTRSAVSAERPIERTSTSSPSFVRVRATRATPTGLVQPVYNLTVEGEHEFVADGVLVSNCDASLYMWRAARNYDATEAPPAPLHPNDPDFAERHMWEEIAERQKAKQGRGPVSARVGPRMVGRFGRP